MDWARLAISETVGQAENANMKEIFTDPEDAQKQFKTMPAWEPHSLAEKVAKYKVPEKLENQQRMQSVTINYAKATNTVKTAAQPRQVNQGQKRTTNTQTPPKTIKETTYKTIAPKQLNNEFDNEIDDAILAGMHIPGSETHQTPMKETRAHAGTTTVQETNAGEFTTRNPCKKATAIQDARIEKLEGEFEKMRKELALTKEHTTTIDNNTRVLLDKLTEADKKTDAIMAHVDFIGKGFGQFQEFMQ